MTDIHRKTKKFFLILNLISKFSEFRIQRDVIFKINQEAFNFQLNVIH